MSVRTSNASATPTSVRSHLAFGALLSRALRLAVILVLVTAGLILVQTYRAMLHDTPISPASIARPPQPDSITDVLPTELLGPGAWSLGDTAWSVKLTELTDPADPRLNSLGPTWLSQTAPPPLERKVLAWLRSSRPSLVGGCRVYDVRAGSVRIRAVTRPHGQKERLQLVQIVRKRVGGAPQLMEVSLAPTERPKSAEDHLLPLPHGIASLARRWDDSGRLSGEVLGPTDLRAECLQLWSTAGWKARQVHVTDASSSFFELSRGGRTIHVRFLLAEGKSSSAYLVLAAPRAAHLEGNR